MQALTDNTGENATPVNPYRMACYEWNEWNKLNPKLPLTERQKPNIFIDVDKIWQYDETSLVWKNAPPERYEKFKSFEDYKQFADRWGIKTRLAYKPTTTPVANKKKQMFELDVEDLNNVYGPGDDNYGRDKKLAVANKVEGVEDLSHLKGLPLSEVYLHGVIAGQKKRIEQLESSLSGATHQDKIAVDRTVEEVVGIIDNSTDGITVETAVVLHKILTKIKALKNHEPTKMQ